MFGELKTLWAIKRFRFLFLARSVSNFGNGVAPIALAFGVLSLPGADERSLSLVTGTQMVPVVVFMLLGGVVADRFGRAQLVGGTDIIGSVVVAISGILLITDHASVIQLCVSGFIFGVLNALWYPAFSGLMPEIVPQEKLQSANSLLGFGANVGFTSGASSAGVIVGLAGPGWGLLTDALTFFVAGLLVWQLRLPRSEEQREAAKRESMITQLHDGWREFIARKWFVIIVVAFAFFNLCFEGFLGVLAPLQMKEQYNGARSMSAMIFGWGVGALLGIVVSMRVKPRRPLVLAMSVMPLLGAWMIGTALALPLWLLVILGIGAGVGLEVFIVMWMTTFHSHIPTEVMSRVGAYDAFGSNVLAPLGLFLAGPFAHFAGTRSALLFAGMFGTAACLLALLSREVRSVRSVTAPTP